MTKKLLFKQEDGIIWVEPEVARNLEFYREIYELLKAMNVPSYEIGVYEDVWDSIREESKQFIEANLKHMAKEGYAYTKKDFLDSLYAYNAVTALIDAGWDYSRNESDTSCDRLNWGLQVKVIFSPLAEQEFRLQVEELFNKFNKFGIREYDILPIEFR